MGAAEGARPELCAALLLLCWLCCHHDHDHDHDEASSSQKHRRKLVVTDSNSRRRSGDIFSRRMGSSAISLHLPSTSGHAKQLLSAHRSHEEIRRRKSHLDANEQTRYHSAPSVIDEVIHRRDWERSSKDLYIPLNPPNVCNDESIKSNNSSSPEAPCAEPESSSIECLKERKQGQRKCKKHHTNIKSSKNKCKESNKHDIKDTDATETPPNFYIGDQEETLPNNESENEFVELERLVEERNKWIYKGKGDKQSFNETIKLLDKSPAGGVASYREAEWDRSGAVHHTIESRMSFSRPYPPPSVDTVGYDGGACYLAETGRVSSLRRAALTPSGPAGAGRARHASDGDILAPPHRPESGAFSESDLDMDLEASEERPPAYHEVQLYSSPDKKETAI